MNIKSCISIYFLISATIFLCKKKEREKTKTKKNKTKKKQNKNKQTNKHCDTNLA